MKRALLLGLYLLLLFGSFLGASLLGYLLNLLHCLGCFLVCLALADYLLRFLNR